MPPLSPIINGFTGGELSPDMEGRTDHEKYFSGCRRLRNMLVRPHGAAFRRPGLRFISEAKHPDKAARLIAFDFDSTDSQSYQIEMGDGYLRFFKDGGQILDDEDAPYEIAAPWTEEQIFDVRFVQTNDAVYLAHQAHRPRKLIRHGHADWELVELDFRIDGYDIEIVDASGDGKKSGKQGDTMTLPAGREFDEKFIVKGQNPDGAVRWFEYHGSGYWQAASNASLPLTFKDADPPNWDGNEIESIYDSSNKLRDEFWAVLESDDSKPENWKDANWPGVVGIFEGRLFFGRTPDKPLGYWGSRTDHFLDFRANTNNDTSDNRGAPYDDDAIHKEISGSRMNPLSWFVDQDDLLFGTSASEGKISSGSDTDPLSPAACSAKRQSGYGSGRVPAKLVADGVLYISRGGRHVREMTWDINTYKYKSPEISILARHITESGVVDMDYAREPSGVLWCALGDGGLAGCTYLRAENVVAWHLHPLGGDGCVESVSVIPGSAGDELWCLVRRTVGGKTKRYIERMDPEFVEGAEDARDGFFVDSGLSYDGEEEIVEVPGLDHLEGETVQILADGAVIAPQSVQGGKVTLPRAAKKIHVGLGYRSVLQPMRFESAALGGTMQTKLKRVMRASVRFRSTVGGKVKAGDDDGGNFEQILPHSRNAAANVAPPVVSQDHRVDLGGEFDTDGLLTIVQDAPLPMTITCVVPEVVPGGSS